MEINESSEWRTKLIKTLEQSYRRSKYFSESFSSVVELIEFKTKSLCEYNLNGIYRFCDILGLDKRKLIFQSELGARGQATDLLIDLVKNAGGSSYLCGGGAGGYQEDDKFKAAGISLIYQNFQHPSYDQLDLQPFAPGLSVIDALMNLGSAGVSKCLKEIAPWG